jgi:hypothetical protein
MDRIVPSIGDELPFCVVDCCWPRPVEELEGHWTSDPEWDAPTMSVVPEAQWSTINGERCSTIDWCQFFGGEMRGFQVVFRLKINRDGRLVFWADDGCVIRRGSEIIHSDRTSHMAARGEVEVSAGDCLEVAQWQYWGGWLWGAWVDEGRPSVSQAAPASSLPSCPSCESAWQPPTVQC